MPFYKVPDINSPCYPVGESAGRGSSSSSAVVTGGGVEVSRPNTASDDADGSDRSCLSNLAEMTEADRDSELLRRDLEQKVQMINQEAEMKQRDGAESRSSASRHEMRSTNGQQQNGGRRKGSVIEKELRLQQQREAELASTRQVIYQDHSPSSSSHNPTAKSSTSANDCFEDEGRQRQTGSSSSASDSNDHTNRDNDVQPRYAHPGESRIIMEMMEHRQRETELRGRWKEMGFDVPEGTGENETPFTLPVNSKKAAPPKREEKTTEDVCHASNGTSNKQDVTDSVGVKVRPYEDPDAIGERRLAYIPANETPIEREIRLSREREDALRQARGLQPVNDADRQRRESTSVEISMTSTSENYNPNADPTVRVNMKKLASSRLQMELLKERERELALKSQGAIHTISEERAGEPVKYVEVISKQQADNHPSVAVKTQAPSVGNQSETKHVPLSPDAQSNGKLEPEREPAVAPVQSGKARQSVVVSRCNSSVETVSELESVFGERQKQQQQMLLRTNSASKPTPAERKILGELKEMQSREEELKNLRKSSIIEIPTTEDLDDDSFISN